MHIDSVRELKAMIRESVVRPFAETALELASVALAARNLDPRHGEPRAFAVGVAPHGRSYRLAVRVQRRALLHSPALERMARLAKGEIEVRYIGRVAKRALWYRSRTRPLRIGGSIGHHKITAGTLGCFVRREGGALLVLSNNHVLADENRARSGDPVIQPGNYDRGNDPADRVALLDRFVRMSARKPNLVDCATASVIEGIEADVSKLTGIGKLRGLGPPVVETGGRVHKIGRTTGITRGRVTAFELDDVVVEYDIGDLTFDDQIEIDGERGAFSDGGDSGSLIVNDAREAVGLLFAGSDQGGRNDAGLTYANPMHTVLKKLGVDLVSSQGDAT